MPALSDSSFQSRVSSNHKEKILKSVGMHDTDTFKKDIHEYYDIEEELGSGQFAVVRKIVEKETGDEFAGKYVRKKRTKASRNGMSREDIKREIEILRMVDHEKIIKVHEVYETDREMILVMELLRGGELFDYISKKDFLTEEEAIDFTRQILQGLQHLHSRNIVHLDLKPENILLKHTRKKTIKLVDFGLARVVKQNEQVREIMGTPEFVAPEVLNFDTISTATDMWALGVIAYILLSGASPFLGEDNQETFTNIIQVDYQFDEEYFSEISDEAKDFIKKLLVKDPRKRPSAHDCSRHTWVEEEVVDKKKRQRRRTTQICTFNFKRFVARKRWKMSYNKIRAMNLIAKMGIKPPPGFVTEIPPMEPNVNVEENKVEAPVPHKEHKEHKDHKKSSINRRKHKQNSTPKASLDKTDSLALKSMDIDIGEGDAAGSGAEVVPSDHEDVHPVEPSPPVSEQKDYSAMSLREKRRARGQLRHHDIVKSKEEIDAKKSKPENEDDNEVEQTSSNGSTPMQQEPELETKCETVTSTMHIEHKPVTKSASTGILKKRETKPVRIPSTEDHYFVTLEAALFQSDAVSSEQKSHQPAIPHGILKHEPKKSEEKPMAISTSHEQAINGEANSEEAVSVFNVEVDVAGREASPGIDSPEESQDSGKETPVDQVAEEEAKPSERKTSETRIVPTFDKKANVVVQNSVRKISSEDKTPKNQTPQLKKSLLKNDNTRQQPQRFSPPPWQTQRKSSNENLKANPKPLQGVSKVSLKANRFMTNDKTSSPKSPTSPSGAKTANVLGKTKIFQKENIAEKNSQNSKKAAATKTNSLGGEFKSVECDINLDDPVESKESSEKASKNLESNENNLEKNKTIGLGNAKPRSCSYPNPVSVLTQSNQNNKATTNDSSRSRSTSAQNFREKDPDGSKMNHVGSGSKKSVAKVSSTPTPDENKVLINGESTTSAKNEDFQNSARRVSETREENPVEKESQEDEKEALTSSSTHSLTEVTIRPRQNSGDMKAGGFDVMLTIGPQEPPPNTDPRGPTGKSRFASSSSSSLIDSRVGIPNGKVLTSASAIDVTSHSRDNAHTGDRHSSSQGSKYTPQRDFSKYLTSESSTKLSQTAKTPSNNTKAQTIFVKRTSAPNTTTPKSKKQPVSTTVYVPRRTFGFTAKPANQTEFVIKTQPEADDTAKVNNNERSNRWSQSSNASDRSASSTSSDDTPDSSVKLENNVQGDVLNSTEKLTNQNSTNTSISKKIENYSSPSLSPRASPVLERKWKATLLVPKECEKVPSAKDRDIRISSANVPRKNKFSNTRSMFEGK